MEERPGGRAECGSRVAVDDWTLEADPVVVLRITGP